jgi:hypothetical protein
MVINQVNVQRILTGEAEYHAPIRSHRDGPESFQVTLQLVKAKAGHSHVRWDARAVEPGKNTCELIDVLRVQLAPVIFLE